MDSFTKSILLAENIDIRNLEKLEQQGYKVTNLEGSYVDKEVIAVFTKVSKRISKDFMSRFVSLKYVLVPATSPDMVDVKYIEENNIRLITLREFESPLYQFRSTTEVTIWHLISLLRKAYLAANSVYGGEWNRNSFYGKNISNARIGILGFGRIGTQVANICKELNMHVYALEQDSKKPIPKYVTKVKSLEDLMSCVDVLTIHVDNDPSNIHLINENSLKAAKGLFLINTSRGRIVEDNSVVAALRDGRLLGYAADTIEGEGHEGNWLKQNPLWNAMTSEKLNIIVTPHIGGATTDNVYVSEKFVIDVFLKLENRAK